MGRIDGLFNNPKEVILRTTEEAKDRAFFLWAEQDGGASAIRQCLRERKSEARYGCLRRLTGETRLTPVGYRRTSQASSHYAAAGGWEVS
jgi:hypothetical protein